MMEMKLEMVVLIVLIVTVEEKHAMKPIQTRVLDSQPSLGFLSNFLPQHKMTDVMELQAMVVLGQESLSGASE
jgi:hypothetical protein